MKNFLNSIRRRKRRGREPADFAEIERAERIFYLDYLRQGMIVFDAGANVGELTALFSRAVGNTGIVHAFEASGATFKRLETVCGALGIRNVRLNRLALAEESGGSIQLHVYDDALSAFNSRALRPLENYGIDVKPLGIEETPAATIDDYCAANEISRIDLLKIDVEGSELQVLLGARKMLESKSVRCLTFEFGQTTFDMGNKSEQIETYLNAFDYKIRNIIDGDPIFPGRESVETARYSMHVAEPV